MGMKVAEINVTVVDVFIPGDDEDARRAARQLTSVREGRHCEVAPLSSGRWAFRHAMLAHRLEGDVDSRG
ncbi:hypothetical protein HR12_43335 [Microbacterium sp. SUBG005]|nr:hypothetical protein HR12_43335 [Microbacterium sp. SUBG005]